MYKDCLQINLYLFCMMVTSHMFQLMLLIGPKHTTSFCLFFRLTLVTYFNLLMLGALVLSRIYNNSCHKFVRENHCKITRYNIGELGTNAYVKGLSPENLRSSFRRTGIYPLNKSPYPPLVYTQTMTDITTDKNDLEEHALDTNDMTDEQNDSTLPLTPIQTDRIDCSPPMDLSPDVTQMHVESPTKNLTPNILTHASADSSP